MLGSSQDIFQITEKENVDQSPSQNKNKRTQKFNKRLPKNILCFR